MKNAIIVFDHHGRTADGAEGPLEVYFSNQRKPYYINTGVRVRREEWAGRVIRRPDALVLNERLQTILNKVVTIITRLIDDGQAIDAAAVRKALWNEDAAKEDALKWLEEEARRMPIKPSTLKHYSTLLTRLRQWGALSSWRDVTVENIMRFDSWLRTNAPVDRNLLRDENATHMSTSAVYTYHKCLKALLRRAERVGKVNRNPYSLLQGQFKKGEKENVEYLTDEEMDAILNFRPLPSSLLYKVRDLFVIQMFTGLSYSDMQAFDISNYHLIDGVWRYTGTRIKTGVPYVSQLLPPVVEVLERWRWEVPHLSNQKYNHLLSVMGEVLGIKAEMHSHLARHTFATYMLRRGVPIEHVSKMLGHTNITQTQRYAKVMAEDVHNDYARIAAEMRGCADVARPKSVTHPEKS